MNIMWIPLLAGSHSPSPGGSDGRPMRPMNLAQSEAAVSSRSASTVPRSTLRATRRRGAGRRPALRDSLTPYPPTSLPPG